MTERIWGFDGPNFFLSNFYLEKDGKSGEHRFQASKAVDDRERASIMAAVSPNDAKYRGRSTKLRPDWESIKIDVMRKVLEYKFSDPDLRAKLLATGDAELFEANHWHDKYWGVDKWTGNGENNLGKLLMELRERLQKEETGG